MAVVAAKKTQEGRARMERMKSKGVMDSVQFSSGKVSMADIPKFGVNDITLGRNS